MDKLFYFRKRISKGFVFLVLVGALLGVSSGEVYQIVSNNSSDTIEAATWGTWSNGRYWAFASKVKKIGSHEYYVYYSRSGLQTMYTFYGATLGLGNKVAGFIGSLVGGLSNSKHGIRVTEHMMGSGATYATNSIRWN
ncbi:MAG: hypothetical protein ABF630_11155 [Liquorilactobacillus sp.]|jgi:hypothetical protein|uniref:hypothetical protein n=1 Tax=Liquorilactobacillus nagelii TaxID=82688 RepID=UPI0039EBD603